MGSRCQVRALYDESYAECYETLYLGPWLAKHHENVARVAQLLDSLPAPTPAWLDLCCGQAWHFSRFDATIRKVGIDFSHAQVERARRRNPGAHFIEGDVLEVELKDASFDLVTCFWAAYAYLSDLRAVRSFLARAARWTRPGGAFYLEALLPTELASFNDSEFARRTGFRVIPRASDWSRWAYSDVAGVHEMVAPRLDFLIDALDPHFCRVEATRDDGFMTHLVAERRPPHSRLVPEGASSAPSTEISSCPPRPSGSTGRKAYG